MIKATYAGWLPSDPEADRDEILQKLRMILPTAPTAAPERASPELVAALKDVRANVGKEKWGNSMATSPQLLEGGYFEQTNKLYTDGVLKGQITDKRQLLEEKKKLAYGLFEQLPDGPEKEAMKKRMYAIFGP